MRKHLVMICLALLAIVVPLYAAISMARSQALDEQSQEVIRIAGSVQFRGNRATRQFFNVRDQLMQANATNPVADPCSADNLELMRRLAFSTSYTLGVGYIANDRLLCSSMGKHGKGLDVGHPNLVTSNQVAIRKAIRLPIASHYPVRILARDGYAAIFPQDTALDIDSRLDGMLLGLYYNKGQELLLASGTFTPTWMRSLKHGETLSFVDDSYLVGLYASQPYDLVGLAALPVSYLTKATYKQYLLMIPLGAAISLLLLIALAYAAKQQGTMHAMMRTALKRNEFSLVYQPIIDLETGRWVSAEALIRWRRHNGDTITPDVFIAEAERTGMITQITERVLTLAAADFNQHFKHFPDFTLSINLSAEDLESDEIVPRLYHMLKTTGMPPHSLVVEATERGFMNAEEARRIINEIRALGIRVAIDDFGTGYSSLSYLTTMALDHLKIDKSFVDTIGKGAVASHVPGHIIAMARSLNLSIVAEGVETAAQADYLRERGVQYAQGWLYSKAQPPVELAQKLTAMVSLIQVMDKLDA